MATTKSSKTKEDERGRWATYSNSTRNVKVPDANKKAIAVFAAISGLFTKKISENGLWAFPAVILAQFCGRSVFLGAIVATQNFTQFTPKMIWSQIQTGFTGLAVQTVLVPVIIIGLRKLLIKDNANV